MSGFLYSLWASRKSYKFPMYISILLGNIEINTLHYASRWSGPLITTWIAHRALLSARIIAFPSTDEIEANQCNLDLMSVTPTCDKWSSAPDNINMDVLCIFCSCKFKIDFITLMYDIKNLNPNLMLFLLFLLR